MARSHRKPLVKRCMHTMTTFSFSRIFAMVWHELEISKSKRYPTPVSFHIRLLIKPGLRFIGPEKGDADLLHLVQAHFVNDKTERPPADSVASTISS